VALKAALAAGQPQGPAETEQAAELERRIDVLAQEIERLKLGEAAVSADRSEHGLGPAASKVYRGQKGVAIGGYGEFVYSNPRASDQAGNAAGVSDRIDLLRAVFYVGYKWNDHFLVNSEIEFEHATTGEGDEERGEASVEFAHVDWLYRKELNLRGGLVLLPVGLINELHEPTVFVSALRPRVETRIIPSTWREMGVGAFGDIGGWSYRTYLVNGLDASRFTAEGLREGRQSGSNASSSDFAWVGRLDYTGRPGLVAGGSLYVGTSGQGLSDAEGRSIGARVTEAEAHADWKWRGLGVRALGVHTTLGDAARLNQNLGLSAQDGVGSRLAGGYLELSYDVLSRAGTPGRSLLPFVRIEAYDTQRRVPAGYERNPANDARDLTVGLCFKPIDQLAIKADYQHSSNAARSGVDEAHVALGYIF